MSTYDLHLYATDVNQFEQWLAGGDEWPNPRIELVKEIIDNLPPLSRRTLEEVFYEDMTRRDIMRRHGLTNVYYAQKMVERALAAFEKAWTAEHGVPEPSTRMKADQK